MRSFMPTATGRKCARCLPSGRSYAGQGQVYNPERGCHCKAPPELVPPPPAVPRGLSLTGSHLVFHTPARGPLPRHATPHILYILTRRLLVLGGASLVTCSPSRASYPPPAPPSGRLSPSLSSPAAGKSFESALTSSAARCATLRIPVGLTPPPRPAPLSGPQASGLQLLDLVFPGMGITKTLLPIATDISRQKVLEESTDVGTVAKQSAEFVRQRTRQREAQPRRFLL